MSMTLKNHNIIKDYIEQIKLSIDQVDFLKIENIFIKLQEMKSNKGTLFICGNGGSSGNSSHLANDFIFGTAPKGDGLSVEDLSANSAIITCLANDIGYEYIFSHQLKVKANSNDILMVLSGSGNSLNIIKAIETAKKKNMLVIGFLGFDGGKAKELVDLAIHFNISDMQISEDMQLIVGHLLMRLFKATADGEL